ncbi:MAG: LOG family protein [Nanoarchaeota archaeon]|nr:LOG family protein [Nanoarchaeota archaeon]
MANKKRNTMDDELLDGHVRVALFGSAIMKKTDPNYKMVYRLSKRIGAAGIDVVTGSGPGLMEAANSGHVEGRENEETHSIGLAIKLPNEQKPNKDVDVLHRFEHFSNRLEDFVLLSNVFVVAPGGVGTLLELLYVLQLVKVGKICDSKMILIGDFWPGFIRWLKSSPLKKNYITISDVNKLILVKNEDEAFKIIDKEFKKFKKLGKKYCLNQEVYGKKPKKK